MNDSIERTLFEWALSLFFVSILGCVLYHEGCFSQVDAGIATSDDAAEENVSPVNHKRSEKEEEEQRKTVIFKLFQSEHIQEKLTCKNIRRSRSVSIGSASTKSCHTIDEDPHSDDDCDLDEEEGHGIVLIGDLDEKEEGEEIDPESQTEQVNCGKMVTNLCAICLEEYHEGDTIVWASNKNCRHAFHRECLASYLAKITTKDANESYPCPCCRQNFFYADETKEKSTSGDE